MWNTEIKAETKHETREKAHSGAGSTLLWSITEVVSPPKDALSCWERIQQWHDSTQHGSHLQPVSTIVFYWMFCRFSRNDIKPQRASSVHGRYLWKHVADTRVATDTFNRSAHVSSQTRYTFSSSRPSWVTHHVIPAGTRALGPAAAQREHLTSLRH